MSRSTLIAGLLLAAVTVSPAISAETIESATYPLWVHYDGPDQHEFAVAVLEATEEAWAFQVDELGLLRPPADSGAHGSDDYDVFINTTTSLARTQLGAPAADRPFGYCSYIIVNPTLSTDYLPLALAHELHHAIQLGVRDMDMNILEAGATYISGIQCQGQAWMLGYFLAFNDFQAHPERSLDWFSTIDYYPYGGALYIIYIDQVYGVGPPGSILGEMYDLMGTAEFPHYFDAAAELFGFDEAYKEFARWRYFVGPHDDGLHLDNLENWNGYYENDTLDSVSLLADLQAEDLPVVDEQPELAPMPYGAVYVRLALEELDPSAGLTLDFAGAEDVRWSIQTILVGTNSPAVEQDHQVAADGTAQVDLEVGESEALIVAFVNLGGDDYQPGDWEPATLTYSITLAAQTDAGPDAGGSGDGCDCSLIAAPSISPPARSLVSLVLTSALAQ